MYSRSTDNGREDDPLALFGVGRIDGLDDHGCARSGRSDLRGVDAAGGQRRRLGFLHDRGIDECLEIGVDLGLGDRGDGTVTAGNEGDVEVAAPTCSRAASASGTVETSIGVPTASPMEPSVVPRV